MRLAAATALLVLTAPTATRAQDHVYDANEVWDQLVFLRGLDLESRPSKEWPALGKLRQVFVSGLFDKSSKAHDSMQFMLEALGAVRPRLDVAHWTAQVLERQVFSHYDARKNTIWLNRNSKRYGDFAHRMMLVGPLAHAIDEHYFKVSRIFEKRRGNHDATFAIGAVWEGSAGGMMQQWGVKHRGGRSMKELLRVRALEEKRNRTCYESPRYFSARHASVLMGLHFLTEGKGPASFLPDIPVGLDRNIEKAYRSPPLSSEQILHPHKYWDKARLDPPVVLGDESDFTKRVTDLCGGSIVRRDTLGEFYCGVLVTPLVSRLQPKQMQRLVMTPRFWSPPASQGWGGDRIYVLAKGGARAVTWITAWDRDQDALEFERQYMRLRGQRLGVAAARKGRLVVLASGFARDKAVRLLEIVVAHGKLKHGAEPFRIADNQTARPR